MDGRLLCEYNMFIRPAYADAVLSLPWEEAARDRGGSWGSLKNILLHILEVEDYWFQHVIAGRLHEWTDWDFESIDSSAAVSTRIAAVEHQTRTFLGNLETRDLDRTVRMQRSGDQPPVDFTLGDILVHVATEEVHHRGELIALLWQMEREPPPMTYLRWIRHQAGALQ